MEKWCGRVFSELGVSNDPERLHSLRNYTSPVSGDQLQSFLAAINWMHDHLINYTASTKPLYELLEVLMKTLNAISPYHRQSHSMQNHLACRLPCRSHISRPVRAQIQILCSLLVAHLLECGNHTDSTGAPVSPTHTAIT